MEGLEVWVEEKIKELTDYCEKNDIEYINISAIKGDNLNVLKDKFFDYYKM